MNVLRYFIRIGKTNSKLTTFDERYFPKLGLIV